ncbi:EI24 domain-containing protein [Oceanicella sp. SM1341]|uniref:EI24 domain-containing protein n=1 Tax=Oceanicella sp. SM1341 TaxID=1548889 RepID=UPI000E497DF0|nr:EI24 domain-containing protein [Oceanicella sp. SM1341]
MIGDFLRAFSQLTDARFSAVLVKSLGLTVVLLVASYFGVGWLGTLLPAWDVPVPFLGEVSLGGVATGFAVVAMILASAFLMFPIASVFIGFFLDDIVEAVEERHYPQLPEVTPQPMLEALLDAARFLGLMIVANLVALVFYLVLAPVAPLIFWLVNGYLLGREYFQMIAVRRMPSAEAEALRKRHFGQIWLAGTLMAIPLSIPILNLVIPILGVATFTHLHHRLTGLRPQPA